MIRYLLLFLFSIFASQSWHALAAIPTNIYDYDASLSYSNDRNTGYEGQNSNYDDTSNFRYCCNEASISDFQEKTLGWSFFAFIDSFIVAKGARNPGNGLKLNKQLGSQQQLGEKGVPIAGAGSKTPLRDSNRLANEYGGNASDWAKRSSTRHKAPDGRSFETHWYENSVTGQRVEPKTIVQEYLQGR